MRTTSVSPDIVGTAAEEFETEELAAASVRLSTTAPSAKAGWRISSPVRGSESVATVEPASNWELEDSALVVLTGPGLSVTFD